MKESCETFVLLISSYFYPQSMKLLSSEKFSECLAAKLSFSYQFLECVCVCEVSDAYCPET
jgi:hypothetical protein